MKTNIIYFSRTGKTKHVAQKLAHSIDSEIFELKDNKNWSGFFGYMKGGFYASKDKGVEVSFDQQALDCEQLIIMSPLWAGGPSPSIRTFIRTTKHPNITLVLTNDGSDVHKAFERSKTLLPEVKRYYGITKKLKNENQVLEQIKTDLNK
ncbi:MAG: hypothetical protein JXR88_06000 [Clostridia bacterium]|nr:hypothetical protein [Clostridia bacterium]